MALTYHASPQLDPDMRADIAQMLERQWEDVRGPTPTSVQELVDVFGGTRAVANVLGLSEKNGLRQPELWLRRERGLGGVSRPIPQARLAELQAAADAELDKAADAQMGGPLPVTFHGEIAAQGNPNYAGYREWNKGVIRDGAPLRAFWADMRAHAFEAAAQSFNDAMMSQDGYAWNGGYDATIWSVDTLGITFPT